MLDYQYRKAFQMLRINTKDHGICLPKKSARKVFKAQDRLAASTMVTYERIAATSLPYLSDEDKTTLIRECGFASETKLMAKVKEEHQFWALALAVLRSKGAPIDLESIPHLEFMF